MFYKLVDGEIVPAPNPLIVDGAHIFTTNAAAYRAKGYKPLVYTPAPEVEDGYTAVSGWTETADAYTQTWSIAPAEESPEELISMLEEGLL